MMEAQLDRATNNSHPKRNRQRKTNAKLLSQKMTTILHFDTILSLWSPKVTTVTRFENLEP